MTRQTPVWSRVWQQRHSAAHSSKWLRCLTTDFSCLATDARLSLSPCARDRQRHPSCEHWKKSIDPSPEAEPEPELDPEAEPSASVGGGDAGAVGEAEPCGERRSGAVAAHSSDANRRGEAEAGRAAPGGGVAARLALVPADGGADRGVRSARAVGSTTTLSGRGSQLVYRSSYTLKSVHSPHSSMARQSAHDSLCPSKCSVCELNARWCELSRALLSQLNSHPTWPHTSRCLATASDGAGAKADDGRELNLVDASSSDVASATCSVAEGAAAAAGPAPAAVGARLGGVLKVVIESRRQAGGFAGLWTAICGD